MRFLNPWGFLYIGSIGLIILLYMLKPRHTELLVSSTYLWDKTLKDMEASRPWQRLKNNILLFLQILIALLLILAIVRPYVKATSIEGDMVVILDCSGSMQADDIAPSRFENARGQIINLIDGMLPGQRMALISMGSKGQIITDATADKGVLREAVRAIEPENGGGGENEAFSMANALATDLQDPKIMIYSDTQFSVESENYYSVVINGDGENVAISEISYSIQEREIIGLSKVSSFGYGGQFLVECYADGQLIDIKEVEIADGETLDIYWKDIPRDTRAIQIALDVEDNLATDNDAFVVIEGEPLYKGILVSDGNVFLEQSLDQYRGLELTRAKPEDVDNLMGYDLYILDGIQPKKLPEDGHVISLGLKEDIDIFELDGGTEFTPGEITPIRSILADELLAYTKLENTYIGKGIQVAAPTWMETILKSGESPLLLAGEQDNRKATVFLFDIKRSDLPLKADFPILIQNILGWMLPSPGVGLERVYGGDEVTIRPMPNARTVEIIDPNGEGYIGGSLQELGVYKIVQDTDRGEYVDYFAVNFPVHSQSDLKLQNIDKEIDFNYSIENIMTRELWKYILWGALAMLLLEWWVYSYGY